LIITQVATPRNSFSYGNFVDGMFVVYSHSNVTFLFGFFSRDLAISIRFYLT